MDEKQVTSRRRLLTGSAVVVGSAAGAVVLGSTSAEAANGSPILAGRSNSATVTTTLNNTGTSGGAHGLIVVARNGYGFEARSATNYGASGSTTGPNKAGVLATHNGPIGDGAALIANGRNNTGAFIKNFGTVKPALDVKALVGPGTSGPRAVTGAVIEASVDTNTPELAFPLGLQVFATKIVHDPDEGTLRGIAISTFGHVHVDGQVTGSSGASRIDHPDDPENKYLSHSFVESPDMANIYNGTVKANTKGEAVVELPRWFDALNKELRYQLTAIGAPAPNLHVRKKVADGRFTIAGAKPGQEICWQLIGTRKDAWANANRVQVEQDKPAAERGTYLFPTGFGKPDTKRLGYREPAGA